MARQTGPVYYTGTIDHIVYYKLFGEQYYLRTKSTLSRKRFLADPAFAKSRERSKEFGSAAQLASYVYQQLPKQNRGRGFMGKLIGQVHKALQKGRNQEEVMLELVQLYGGKQQNNNHNYYRTKPVHNEAKMQKTALVSKLLSIQSCNRYEIPAQRSWLQVYQLPSYSIKDG